MIDFDYEDIDIHPSQHPSNKQKVSKKMVRQMLYGDSPPIHKKKKVKGFRNTIRGSDQNEETED